MTITAASNTPYTKYLAGREPTAASGETIARIRTIVSAWLPADFERTYAPGKWTARQILIHLAHAELALGTRARMGLTVPNYIAQAFDQDAWLAHESTMQGPDALAAFVAVATMNRIFFQSLSPADRQKTMSHPEYGSISVDWVIHAIAGHQINHLLQLEQVAGAGQGGKAERRDDRK